MNWNTLIITLVTQGTTLLGIWFTANKDDDGDKENLDISTQNAMLRMDLKRICDAIDDDLPYNKLKEIASHIEDSYKK